MVIILIPANGLTLCAQEKSAMVLDSETGKPVPFATISLVKEGHALYKAADQNGRFSYPASYPLVVSVSGIGYKSVTDTINSPADSIVMLTPAFFDLDEVVVTGRLTPVIADRSIYNVSVLSKLDIEHKAATDLTGLLTNELDIRLSQEGILGRTLDIRGLSGEYIKILINGMPVAGRQNGIIDLGQLNLNTVDHVEIVKGPLSVMYGSNALGGTVNIITNTRTPGKFSAGINGYYETAGVYNVYGSFMTRFKNQYIGFSMARNFFQGFDPGNNSRYKLWKPKLQVLPGLSYRYEGKKVRLSFDAEYLQEELRDLDSLSARYYYEKAEERYYFTRRLNNTFSLGWITGARSSVQFSGGYSYYAKIKNAYINDLVNLRKQLIANPELQDTTTFHQFSQRAQYMYTSGKSELVTGVDINQEYGNGERINGHKDIEDYAVFTTFLFTPAGHLSFQPGIRLAYNSRYKAPLVWSLNLKYDPGNYRFRASYGKGFRTPSLKELYMEFIDQNHHVFGNENLKAEIAHSFTVSGARLFNMGKNKMQLSIDAYYNRIFNKIDFLFDPVDPTRAKYFNIGSGVYRTQGSELEMNFRLSTRLILNTGLAINGISGLSDPVKFSYSRDYLFSVHYTSPFHQAGISAFYKYTGQRVIYTGMYDMNEGLQEIREAFLEGYHNLDITVTVPLDKNRLVFSTGVKNVFNNITLYTSGVVSVHSFSDNTLPVGWGRTLFLKLSYRFIKY